MRHRSFHFSRKLLGFSVAFSLLASTHLAFAGARGLATSGNRIVTTSGQTWVGHGVNVYDPRNNFSCYDSQVRGNDDPAIALRRAKDAISLGANFIRLPLESDMRQLDQPNPQPSQSDLFSDPNYLPGIVKLVNYITANPNVYVLVAVWHDLSLVYNPGNHTYSGQPTQTTDAVLNLLVDTFHANPGVMYGVSNEPFTRDDYNIRLAMDHAVDTIRARESIYSDPPHIVAVQGRFYTNNISYYVSNPIQSGGGKNVVYEAHLYDFNTVAPVLAASSSIPVLIGEYGPSAPADPNVDWQGPGYDPKGNSFSLAQIDSTLRQFRAKELTYAAWAYNQIGPPNMLLPTPRDANRTVTCNPNTVSPALTSWGKVVGDDLSRRYFPRRLSASLKAAIY